MTPSRSDDRIPVGGPHLMANTYSSLNYHIIFSTKNRYPWLALGIEQRVWSYIGGIARKHKMTALQVGDGRMDTLPLL